MNSDANQATEYFLSKLTKNNVDYIDIIGLNVAILYSKELFKRNSDISEFLNEVYNINFLPYVMRSRTLIVARITRELNNKTPDELNQIRKKLVKFLNPESDVFTKSKTKNSKQNSNEKLKKWLEGL